MGRNSWTTFSLSVDRPLFLSLSPGARVVGGAAVVAAGGNSEWKNFMGNQLRERRAAMPRAGDRPHRDRPRHPLHPTRRLHNPATGTYQPSLDSIY